MGISPHKSDPILLNMGQQRIVLHRIPEARELSSNLILLDGSSSFSATDSGLEGG